MYLTYLILGASLVMTVAWIPVFRHFFRQWRQRTNPISLAICFVLMFVIYTNLSAFFFLRSHPLDIFLAMRVVDAAVCAFFYASFRWAKLRWAPKDDERRQSDQV